MAPDSQARPDMPDDRIDFISVYCDSWCERCAFTARCSAFAVRVASAMCDDDIAASIELAVGRPRPVEPEREEPEPEWRRDLLSVEITPAELAECGRVEEARRRRVEQSPVVAIASGLQGLAREWLDAHREEVLAHGDAVVADAIDIVSWDVYFIGVKLHRALAGRDRLDDDNGDDEDDFDDDPIQNDWNGSAKVALISIERSAAAWRTIAEATGDAKGAHLAEELSGLRLEVERAFPDAWSFVRPGLDDDNGP